MLPINSIDGLLEIIYLTGSNFSFIHKVLQKESLTQDEWRKAALVSNESEMDLKLKLARENTSSCIELLKANNIKVIPYYSSEFPVHLLKNKNYPPLLFVKGNISSRPLAAIVGSRECSPLAKTKTEIVVKSFLDRNYGTVSGLALGIDSLAHEETLKYNGFTIAVLPCPLTEIYPVENAGLANRILDSGGALISELPPGLSPVFNPFVSRNRIQAALSDYVVAIEMSKDSGTQYTVAYAVRYLKNLVLCMPGKMEIDNYLDNYEGILYALKKYRSNYPHLHLLNDFSRLPEKLNVKQEHAVQPDLF